MKLTITVNIPKDNEEQTWRRKRIWDKAYNLKLDLTGEKPTTK